jgi:hypothetical protein
MQTGRAGGREGAVDEVRDARAALGEVGLGSLRDDGVGDLEWQSSGTTGREDASSSIAGKMVPGRT